MAIEKFAAAKVLILYPTEDKFLLVLRVIDGQVVFEPDGGRLDVDFDQKLWKHLKNVLFEKLKKR